MPSELPRIVGRIVGLKSGRIVYDGPPDGLTPEVLTTIYGEEDWTLAKPGLSGGDTGGGSGEDERIAGAL